MADAIQERGARAKQSAMTDLKNNRFTNYFPLLLDALRSTHPTPMRPAEAIAWIRSKIDVPALDLTRFIENGKQSIFENNVHWARFYLSKAHLIGSPERGLWGLTPEAKKCRAALREFGKNPCLRPAIHFVPLLPRKPWIECLPHFFWAGIRSRAQAEGQILGNIPTDCGVNTGVKGTAHHRAHWLHFEISLASMLGLAVFTVWRAAVTAWRPPSARFYFFPNDTWIGVIDNRSLGDWLSRIDHSWLNDFLLGPGTVACFFVAFTALYAADGLFHADPGSIFTLNQSAGNDSSWADHKQLMKIILYALLVRALGEAWGEEVGIIDSALVFDPWDLTVELAGVVVGAWLVHTLSYPLFSRVPQFGLDSDIPDLNALLGKFGADVLSVLVTGFYIFIVDPFDINPLTLGERQILCLEVALMFVAFRTGLHRGMNPSSGSIHFRPPLTGKLGIE